MAQAKTGPNWFAIVIATITVVALVGVAALVIVLNNRATAPGVAPTGAIINSETGGITVGAGEDTVAVYLDFMCPACGQFEAQYGELLNEAAGDDRIALELHPIAIQDNLSQGTQFSSRAGSALYCVASEAPEAVLDFQLEMFANQPSQGSRGLSDEQIIAIAEQTGAGAASDCISDGTYMKFVQDRTPETPAGPDGRIGTPTVVINGERLGVQDVPGALVALLG